MRAQTLKLKVSIAAAVVTLALGGIGALALTDAHGADLNQLQSELGATSAKQQSLHASIAALNGQVSTLDQRIGLVESRQAAVQTTLDAAEARVAADQASVAHQRKRAKAMRARMKLAEQALAAELVSRYEQPQESLVTVLVDSNSFQQLLDQVQDLRRANDEEQAIIRITRAAKDQAQAAAARLQKLEDAAQQAAQASQTQAQALAGMQTLLDSQRSALADEQSAQATALAAANEKGARLGRAIAHVRAQELAAEQATQQVTGSPVSSGGSGDDDGWAIPYAIVLCESGGQNLPPNSAGASGYYQIIPSTWQDFGGTGPAAYLASKAEQDAVAAKIWNGGAGASNWACSAIVGIT